MNKPKSKRPQARDATGVIEWSSLSTIEKEAFLMAYNNDSALESRCAYCLENENSKQATIASFLKVYEGSLASFARCLEQEQAKLITEELRRESRESRRELKILAGISKQYIKAYVWLCIKDHDFSTLEWLAGHIKKLKSRKKALSHKQEDQDSQEIEITVGSTLPAVILKHFLELSGVDSTFILTSKTEEPRCLPTKAYLKEKVRSAWEKSGHKAAEMDSDFAGYCTAMGLGGLPVSSRNPAWHAKI